MAKFTHSIRSKLLAVLLFPSFLAAVMLFLDSYHNYQTIKSQDQIAEIVGIQLRYLQQRLLDRDMRLELTDAAVAKLAEAGYDPVYGARPLKRAIQHRIENPLAQEILAGALRPGDVVKVDVEDGEIVFRQEAAAAA